MDICIAGSIINNELDCPLLEESHRCEVVPSISILDSVSLIHECGDSCEMQKNMAACMERENVTVCNRKTIKHDQKNKFYCFNIYCMHNSLLI